MIATVLPQIKRKSTSYPCHMHVAEASFDHCDKIGDIVLAMCLVVCYIASPFSSIFKPTCGARQLDGNHRNAQPAHPANGECLEDHEHSTGRNRRQHALHYTSSLSRHHVVCNGSSLQADDTGKSGFAAENVKGCTA